MMYIPRSTHTGVADRYKINQAIPLAPYFTAGDLPNLTSLLAGTSVADPNGTTGIRDVALPTDVPPASLVQITALPPATTSAQDILPKLPFRPQLNVLYLIPLFIALGVVLGAITAAIMLNWRDNRWRVRRTSSFLPGPPYVPPENDVEDRLLVHAHPSMEQVSLFAASTPSKFTIHGSRYIPKRTFARKTVDMTLPSHPIYTQIIPSSDGEKFTVVTEEDPFLPTSSMITRRSPKSSDDVPVPQIRVSPSQPDRDTSGYSKAQQTGTPKPFRRSMFDILKLKSPYRSTLGARKEYTTLTRNEEPGDKTNPANSAHRASSVRTTPAGESISHSVRLSLDGDFNTSDLGDVLGLLGSQGEKQDAVDSPALLSKQTFCLKEGRLSSPTQVEKVKKQRKVTPFASKLQGSPKEAIRGEDKSMSRSNDIEEENHPDIYTKAPQRRCSRTPRKRSTDDASRRSSAPDTHASVLPISPPSLMSPPLEKSLFFASPLPPSASLASHVNTLTASHSSPVHHVDATPELSLFPLPSNKTKSPKKLRTKRSEPPLPYPPYPDHVPAKPTPRERSNTTQRRTVSPGSPKLKGRSTSAAHPESTGGVWSLGSLSQSSLAIALASSSSADVVDKVNDIVASGYSKRRSIGGEANIPDPV